MPPKVVLIFQVSTLENIAFLSFRALLSIHLELSCIFHRERL